MKKTLKQLHKKVDEHLQFIYPELDAEIWARKLVESMCLDRACEQPKAYKNHWSQKDIIAITYGDTLVEPNEKPLKTLHQFFLQHFKKVLSGIHILPFYPYSSDDGFSVIHYKKVNEKLGDWPDIEAIAKDFDLMADLVLNHCSSRSGWFESFKRGQMPEKEYFFTAKPEEDLSAVTRPRTNDLLREVDTLDGKRYVWCTFSHDQVDLNFANPEVLREMVRIIEYYLERGVRIFRFDAVAFIWKTIGTNCLSLPQTHEIIRLLRTLIEHKCPKAIIITETNIPNRENLAYFGNANEAHVIYNFALPPLLLHGLITGETQHLNNWLMSMPPAQDGTTYLNFIASHDGIGLRPVEGILQEAEIQQIADTMQSFGGRISWRNLEGGGVKPYELNISLVDALSGTVNGRDDWQYERFICAHIIMLGLEGIPAFYIHSLLATGNDQEKVERSGSNRAINRHAWDLEQLQHALADENSRHARVLKRLKNIIRIRRKQASFHPNATQYTLHLGEGIFAFWRQSRKRDQSTFCIHNISDRVQALSLRRVNLVETHDWYDLLNDQKIDHPHDEVELQPYQCMWLSNKPKID